MDEVALLNSLVTVWVAITSVFAGLLMWRSWMSFRTDNIVVLDSSEFGVPVEKVAVSAKIERIAFCARIMGGLSFILLFCVVAVLIHQAGAVLSRTSLAALPF